MSFREFLELNESKNLKEVERFLKSEGVKYSVQTFLNGTFKVYFEYEGKKMSALIDGDIIDATFPNKTEKTYFIKGNGLYKMLDDFYSL